MAGIVSKKALLLSGLALLSGCRCFHGNSTSDAPILTEHHGITSAPGMVTTEQSVASISPYGPIGGPSVPNPATAMPLNELIKTPMPIIAKGTETNTEELPAPKIIPPSDVVTSNEKTKETPAPISPEVKPASPMKGPELLPVPGPAINVTAPKTIAKPTSATKADEFFNAPSVSTSESKPLVINFSKETEKPAVEESNLKPGQKFGHANDYRWVAGVLDRHQKGGYWTIRYADYSSEDRWGGKIRLMNAESLKDYKDGDIVLVEGELLAPNSPANRETGNQYPPFKLNSVKLIERGR